MPCRTLQYTITQRSKDNDTLLIDGRNGSRAAEYLEEVKNPISISHKLMLQGINGTPTINFFGSAVIMKVDGRVNRGASLTVKELTFKMNKTRSTLFLLTDASFSSYKCTFLGRTTAIDFRWGSPSDLIIQKSAFIGVEYGVKTQHSCADGKMEVSDSTFDGIRGTSKTGFQLTSICLPYPFPKANINMRIERTYMTGFATAMGLSVSCITLLQITVYKCNFSKQTSGAILIGIGRRYRTYTKVSINDSTFRANQAESGGAIMVASSFVNPENVKVNITNCTFEGNKANTLGGAVAVTGGLNMHARDSLFVVNDCRYKTGSPFSYGRGSGGAVGIDPMGKNINARIENSTFKNNGAASFGGAIYAKASSKDSSLLISNTKLENLKKKVKPAIEGDLIYSAIYANIEGVTSQIHPIQGSNGIRLTGRRGSRIDRLSEFTVTPGYTLQLAAVPAQIFTSVLKMRSGPNMSEGQPIKRMSDTASEQVGGNWDNLSSKEKSASITTAILYHEYSLNFFSCPYNHYSLGESVFKELAILNSNCKRCPDGGTCPAGKLQAKENFWGYLENHGKLVRFTRVAEGYGCRGDECVRYNSCGKDRIGRLCATCRTGFSENFLSTNCIPNNECNSKTFWIMAFIFMMIYTPLFLYKKELSLCIKHHLLWFRRRQNQVKSEAGATTANYVLYQHQPSINAGEQEPKDDHIQIRPLPPLTQEGGQAKNDVVISGLKICFYFYQIEPVLNVQVSEVEINVLNQVRDITRNAFNFLFTSNSSSTCFSINATPVDKILLRVGFIGLILAVFVFLYAISIFIEKILSSRGNGPKFSDRVLAILFEVFLQCYAILVSATFKLIKCVKVDGKWVLYIQGTVQCLVYWQYLFIVVAVFWVIPFCITVFLLPHLLMKKQIRRGGLFIACVLPLLYLIILTARHTVKRLNRKVHGQNEKYKVIENDGRSNKKVKTENSETHKDIEGAIENQDKEDQDRDHALNLIFATMTNPFIRGNKGKDYIWWDGMLMLRRLVVIAIASLIEDPYIRLYLLLLLQILFLLHHVHAKPFSSGAMNAVETVSLIVEKLQSRRQQITR